MTTPGDSDMTPEGIERRSFAIITEELANRGVTIPTDVAPIVKRVIHTSADFEYAENLFFSPGAVERGIAALRNGSPIVTDTQMAKAGINKRALQALGGEAHCHIADDDVASAAAVSGGTRARAAVDKAAGLWNGGIFVVGNAPTALMRICEHVRDKTLRPALVVGVPVGFVNVVESKELLLATDIPHIVARGRKGGSAIAAAICNALLSLAAGRVT